MRSICFRKDHTPTLTWLEGGRSDGDVVSVKPEGVGKTVSGCLRDIDKMEFPSTPCDQLIHLWILGMMVPRWTWTPRQITESEWKLGTTVVELNVLCAWVNLQLGAFLTNSNTP